MSAEPASKKRKLKSADLHDNIFKAKQKGLWFDDGNIVIVAENTPFLVHKSVLAAKSEIFHDTFSVPQPENDESLNGIPILRLHDTWTDVCKLLTFMYHCERYLGRDKVIDFSYIKSFLHLGTKYEVKTLRQEAIRRLRIRFPICQAKYVTYRDPRDEVINITPIDVLEVITLARLHDLPDLLPTAFYECTQLLPSQTLQVLEKFKDPRSTLSASDLTLIIDGRSKLVQADSIFLEGLKFKADTNHCVTPDTCSQRITDTISSLWEFIIEEAGGLVSKRFDVHRLFEPDAPCTHCFLSLKEDCKEHHREMWSKLGEIFGVEPWPMKATDL